MAILKADTDKRQAGKPAFLVSEGQGPVDTGMDFALLVLDADQTHTMECEKETAILLMQGRGAVSVGSETRDMQRDSFFHEDPSCVLISPGGAVKIEAADASEWALVQTTSNADFGSKWFRPDQVRSEKRGAGTMQETSTRVVRTIFDYSNTPESNLVLGEVINYPGKWSSYSPHHHAQPEIYHYRFLPEQGFGAGFCGDDVYKVEHGDTLLVPGGRVHPQTAAPGYAMYYIWAIRHQPEEPYTGPTFLPEHTWVMEDDAVVFPDRRS